MWLVKLGLSVGCIIFVMLRIEEVVWREGFGGFIRLGFGVKCLGLDWDGR